MLRCISIIIVTLICAFAVPANAATFYWEKQGGVTPGRESKISLMMDTQGEAINAIEGMLIVPEGLDVKSTDDGGSIISLWIEKPPISKNEMFFSGGLPGGYNGKTGKLFTLSFVAGEARDYIFEMKGFKALINDGLATEAKVSNKKITLSVDKISTEKTVQVDDLYPPENFTPVISRQVDTFDDKYFLVFSTTDKNSGIDYYEVREGEGRFVRAGSPYLLKNQDSISGLVVRAIDRAGNVREAEVNLSEAINKKAGLGGNWLLLLVGMSVCLMLLAIIYKKRKI